MQKLIKRKILDGKTFVSQEFSVISPAKTFANFEFRLCLCGNFQEKEKRRENHKTFYLRKFLPSKVFCSICLKLVIDHLNKFMCANISLSQIAQ